MIIVQLAGGLGNQMFQYSAGRYLSVKHNTELKFDLALLLNRTPKKDFVFRDYNLDVFFKEIKVANGNQVVTLSKYGPRIRKYFHLLRKTINQNLPVYFQESLYSFESSFFDSPSNVYLEGYWQSEEYFKPIENIIRNEFIFREDLDVFGKEIAKRISSVNSVCIFVRRREYVTIPKINEYLGVCNEEYYLQAIDMINEKIDNPYYYIFSDDIEWCKLKFEYLIKSTIVGHEYAGKKYGQYINLMRMCNHFIISNSSYGWWGAWLNPDSNKIVITPKQWYKNTKMDTSHLIPKEWIRI